MGHCVPKAIKAKASGSRGRVAAARPPAPRPRLPALTAFPRHNGWPSVCWRNPPFKKARKQKRQRGIFRTPIELLSMPRGVRVLVTYIEISSNKLHNKTSNKLTSVEF
jgi:hypothetical protein